MHNDTKTKLTQHLKILENQQIGSIADLQNYLHKKDLLAKNNTDCLDEPMKPNRREFNRIFDEERQAEMRLIKQRQTE